MQLYTAVRLLIHTRNVHMTIPDDDPTTDELALDELLPWIEFGCWTAIALFPFLYWVNGPAVSTDQYVMRNILMITAVVGAVGLRVWNWRATRQAESGGTSGAANSADDVAKSSD